jgi:hypothetical protein
VIVSESDDEDAAAARMALAELGVDAVWVDAAGAGPEVTAWVRAGEIGGRIGGAVLERVSCVWDRRGPGPRRAADVVLECLPALNRRSTLTSALRPLQLVCAGRAGLRVPASVLSTEALSAETVTALGGADMTVATVPTATSELPGEGVDADDSMPLRLFQHRAPRLFEVRLTAADEALHGVRIDSPDGDWRVDQPSCAYARVEVPAEVAAGVRALLAQLGLRFGVADFVVDAEDRWWFLSVDANGRWLRLEHATGLPISASVAAALARPAPVTDTRSGQGAAL